MNGKCYVVVSKYPPNLISLGISILPRPRSHLVTAPRSSVLMKCFEGSCFGRRREPRVVRRRIQRVADNAFRILDDSIPPDALACEGPVPRQRHPLPPFPYVRYREQQVQHVGRQPLAKQHENQLELVFREHEWIIQLYPTGETHGKFGGNDGVGAGSHVRDWPSFARTWSLC